jgi:two-component system sensor histidine kinase UhpB
LKVAHKIQAVSAQEEDHLRLVIDTIPAMAWSLLPDGTVDFVNQRWLEYTGFTRETALAKATSIVHPDDLPGIMEDWLKDMPAGKPSEREMRLRRADGEYRWFLVRTVPLVEQGAIVKWYGTGTDIEDRVRAERALRDAASQLKALSRRLVRVQESERKELARELHDRVGQTLTALNINLAILRQALSPGDAALRSRVDDSAALVESSMESIGNVLSDLRPQMLDDHGLRAALEWYAMLFSARSGIAVSVRAGEPDERPVPDVEIALFRIAQEALNNVTKHAQAHSIEIALECDRFGYLMTVADDGVGLGASIDGSSKARPGLGMVTMRERAQAVGGEVLVESLPQGGTRLAVRVPL